MTVDSGLAIDVTAVSHRGAVREANEDSLGFAGWAMSSGAGLPLRVLLPLREPVEFVVADGLGGHQGGAEASRMAVDTIFSTAGGLGTRVEAASEAIFERGHRDPVLRGMGTTIAGVRVEPSGDAVVFNVGDSRVYRVADGYVGMVSVDDRPAADSVHTQGVVTQVLGGSQRTAVDVHRSSLLLAAGDRLLVCTDGLSDVVDDDQLGGLLAVDAALAGQGLLQAALTAGAPDNVTFLILDVVASDGD